jgi:hypothetical protein
VVWEGRSREVPPYPDQWPEAAGPPLCFPGEFQRITGRGVNAKEVARMTIALKTPLLSEGDQPVPMKFSVHYLQPP